MKQIRQIMGMPVIVEIVDQVVSEESFEEVFSYFRHIDDKFSVYKKDSEITKINNNEIKEDEWSEEMKEVFKKSEATKELTNGYFDIKRSDGSYDPSGLVKGWAIFQASQLLAESGFKNFYVEAGGDIQVSGKNNLGQIWKIGITNPFHPEQIVKVIYLNDLGIATSGTYRRGQHIYNPKERSRPITDIVSFSVIGPNVYEADRFATAAFAMGLEGIDFIERQNNLEGYMIKKNGMATATSGFKRFTVGNQ